MSDEEYEAATPEQKLNIARYILMSSPTGEVQEVLLDVQKLVDDDTVLTNEKIRDIMKKYNEQEYQPVTVDGKSVLVSQHGAVGEDEYLDPNTGKVFKFDHKKNEHTGDAEKKQSLADNIASYRSAISDAMDGYLHAQYKKDKCTVAVYGADDGAITICLSARNVKLSAYWTGGWRTTATLSVGTKGTTELKSATKVNVHYFEDGNVQLHATIEKMASVNVSDEKSTGESVVKAIKTIESDFQTSLEEMYVDMHHNTFKSMRRFLPITKQPMKWNQYAHSIVQGK